MTKSELKNGMIVTTRNGNEYVVFFNVESIYEKENYIGVLVNASSNSWLKLTNYNENLYCSFNGVKETEFDIIKIEKAPHPYAMQNLDFDRKNRVLLWEREEVKEVTMAEVEEKFGCKVKIVNND